MAKTNRGKTKKRPKIYLAGPIAGCNSIQMKAWRQRVRADWEHEFEFIDPAESLVAEGAEKHEAVRRDLEAIRDADGVLANMWKESIGTAIGVVLAKVEQHKTVVVVDPNHLKNRILTYFADAVTDTPKQGMQRMRELLRLRREGCQVLKHKGGTEAFDVRKLAESIRRACGTAKKNDLFLPVEIVPMVLDALGSTAGHEDGLITTTGIKNAVWSALQALEANTERQAEFAGIRDAWERWDGKHKPKTLQPFARKSRITIHPKPLSVPVETSKAHHCIWGTGVKSILDIPESARPIFEHIARVDGIAKIRIGRSAVGSKQLRLGVEFLASKSRGLIEGRCYDPLAERGRCQVFQIVVHDHDRTEDVRSTLIGHLGSVGLARTRGRRDPARASD